MDLLFIVPGRNRGAETYVDSLLPEMHGIPGLDIVCLTNKSNHSRYEGELGFQCRCAPISGSNRMVRVLYQQLFLNSAAKRLGGDVLFCPGYLSPVRPSLPVVSVIHDMNFRDIPKTVSAWRRLLYNIIIPRALPTVSSVITVSQFGKERIENTLGYDGHKVVVVHAGPLANRDIRGDDWSDVKRKYGVQGDCFLSISSGDAHKNIERLVQGFVEAKRKSPGEEQLVLVGHHLDDGLRSYLDREGFRDAVVATGFVSEAEKIAFLRNSIAYFFPSLYEGFGLPALEAQSCGLPLAASRYGSLPEVCGQGALYFDAMSIESISDAFLELRGNEELRKRLIQAGYDNVSRFSWKRAAQETLAILSDAAARSGEPVRVKA